MKVYVKIEHVIYVCDDRLEDAPFGTRLERGEKLPTYRFRHDNFLEAEEAAENLQDYVDEFVLKLPSKQRVKPQKVRADRR
jgi:hypothetical protein